MNMHDAPHQNTEYAPRIPSGLTQRPLIFLFLFILIFILLQTLYYAIPEGFLVNIIINRGIVAISAAILNGIFAVPPVQAVGTDLVSATARLSVVRGCDGTAILFVLIAAIVAVRARPTHLCLGLILATGLIYILNQIRIIWLFLLLQTDPHWFHLAHIYVAPAGMVLISATGFLWWASRLPGRLSV